MKTTSNNNKISIGKQIGTNLLKEIKNAKESVKIVSPYLSAMYIEELVNLSKKGVKITLITADELSEDKYGFSKFKHEDIIKQKRTEKRIKNPDANTKRKKLKKITIISALIALLVLLASILFFPLVYFSIFLVILSGISLTQGLLVKDYESEYKSEYYSIFRIKVFDSSSGKKPQSRELIHSKIFVIDEKTAFLGSANFTYSGFNSHYETLIEIGDQKAVNDISQEVEDLYNSTELSSKSIDDWGREIYG